MSDGGRRSTRTKTELALVQQGPVVAAAVFVVVLVLNPVASPATALVRVAAAAVFAAAGWLAVRTRGAAAVGAALFVVLLAMCAAATVWQLAGGDGALAAAVGSAAALALFLLWSTAHLVAPILPRDPAFEVLRRVEAARAFAATMDDEEDKRHADEILAMLAEAEPYRRPDTAEYLDLALARWRDYLGVGPVLPDRKAAAERSGEIHVALVRRFRPYRAWMAGEASR